MVNLKKRRNELGYTGAALGKLVNVKKSAISKYESGEILPSLEVLQRLSDVLECSTDYLLGREARFYHQNDLKETLEEISRSLHQKDYSFNGGPASTEMKTIVQLCIENCLKICDTLKFK